jgi:hypothetical protein
MSCVAFMEALATIAESIEGVRKSYGLLQGGPASLSSTSLPAAWVEIPGLESAVLMAEPVAVTQFESHTWTHWGSIVVAVAPIVEGKYGSKLHEALTMVDSARAAVWAARSTLGVGTPAIQITLTPALAVAGTQYWGVRVLVQAMA